MAQHPMQLHTSYISWSYLKSPWWKYPCTEKTFTYYTYVIIGVTLGAVLAIGFLAVIICMIKAKMIDSGFGGEVADFVVAAKFNIFNGDLTLTSLMFP
ncbi:hypothetical protein EK904_003031 [Melospiza melodia maxima]|nr:hypothetical protein EK904_003031 [Melospiza melodia maxima]